MLLSSSSSSLPEEWMTLAYSTWVSVRLWSGFSSSCWARIIRLFSGVRSSWDMLAMNSDLYFEETASWLTFSSIRRLDASTSRFFCSATRFCSASRLAWRARSSLDPRSSSCWERSSSAWDCDCLSSVSVSPAAWIVFSTMPDALGDRVEERLVGRAERGEGGELDDGAQRSLEQDRQHDDVQGNGLAEPELMRT